MDLRQWLELYQLWGNKRQYPIPHNQLWGIVPRGLGTITVQNQEHDDRFRDKFMLGRQARRKD